MKFFLFILICTGIGGECMPPIEMQQSFETKYDCLVTGYDVYKCGVFELNPNEVSVKLQSTTAIVLDEIRTFSNMELFKN